MRFPCPDGSLLRNGCLVRGLLAGIALVCVCPVGPASALDFELHSAVTVEDGVPRKHACFRYDEHTNVMIDLPHSWSTTSTAAAITCVPTNTGGAEVRIEKSTLTPGTPFANAGLDVYRQHLLSIVPHGAASLRLGEEKRDRLPVFGWKDYEFTVAFDFFSQQLLRSVMFINLNDKEQIMVIVTGARPGFDQIHAQAMDVMLSWSPVPAN
jgi:hypothetical protein